MIKMQENLNPSTGHLSESNDNGRISIGEQYLIQTAAKCLVKTKQSP